MKTISFNLKLQFFDLIVSVFIVSFILNLFNYHCFKIIRIFIVNDKNELFHNLSLRILIEISITD